MGEGARERESGLNNKEPRASRGGEPEKVDNGSILRRVRFSSRATCGFATSQRVIR